LCVGGHSTYAREPVFNWLRDYAHWHRNHYDRVGHFAQGLVPALIAREMFIRLNILNRKRWQPFLIISICLAISVIYEFIE
jgi:putative membrane protein